MTRKHDIRRVIGTVALTGAALAAGVGASLSAFAEGKGIDEPFREGYHKALAGKTVAYVPVALGFDLAQGWLEGLKKELEPLGVKIVVRDPNWNTNAGAQAVTTLISEKPDVMVAAQPRRADLRQADPEGRAQGIDVVQINMRSAYPSVVYVGADWIEIGEKATTAVADACKGKSNKIAVVQGALSAAASAYTLKGVENVLAKHPELKVVSSQAADWDAAKAKGITQTVLKQHPDLCGIVGFWDGMDFGHRGGDQGGRPDGQGVPRHLRRRRAEGRLRPGQGGRVRPRHQLRRADAGEQHGGADQVAAAEQGQAQGCQGLDLHHADPDHQGQRLDRGNVLEARQDLTHGVA